MLNLNLESPRRLPNPSLGLAEARTQMFAPGGAKIGAGLDPSSQMQFISVAKVKPGYLLLFQTLQEEAGALQRQNAKPGSQSDNAGQSPPAEAWMGQAALTFPRARAQGRLCTQ